MKIGVDVDGVMADFTYDHWWNKPEIMVPYLLTSLGVAAFGGRAYTLFLKHAWYPMWKVKF